MRPDQNLQEVKNKEKRLADDADAMAKFDQATAAFEKERAANLASKKKDSTGNVTTKGKEKPVETAKEDGFSRFEKMLMEDRQAAKDAREQAKWMRVIEAGLGIMGGTSPYAAENIGKGAATALKGYGEDLSGYRKDDRQSTKDLLEIQKERADADYKAKLLRVQELAATKPSGISELAQLFRTDPELARLVQGQGKSGMMTFEEAYKIVVSDLKNAGLSDAEKVQKAKDLMASAAGGAAAAPTVLTYVPGQKLK
jgi:hypothetical protein